LDGLQNQRLLSAPHKRRSQFDMQDDDSIDAFVEQIGGCALRVAAAA
jgi:hypothetical protein